MGLGLGFGFGFDLFTVVFFLIFLLCIITFTVILVKGISQWNKNNHSPRLTVPATIVTKRADVSHHHHDNAQMHYTTHSTTYYATFQVSSGDRMELLIPSQEYGMLVEGDHGNLTFQGTRYLGFVRT